MEKRGPLTKILAIAGTVLVWLPIVAPLLLSVPHFIRARVLMVDYLMPAELFPIVLVGGILLIWAALRARAQRALIVGGLGAAVALLVGAQVLAEVTGLASGEMEPAGIWWALVVASFVLFIVGVLAVGVGGGLLLRDTYRNKPVAAASA